MRYKPGQKQETKRKMTVAASQTFREFGYSGVGVDGLAKAAGVTSGAFYTHFGSKEAAFVAALDLGLDEVIEAVPKFQHDHGTDWIQAFAVYYLGKAHREDLGGGCAMTALTPEVIRSAKPVHETYEEKMTQITALMACGLAGDTAASPEGRAWAVLAILIGGLNLARAMSSGTVINTISNAVIDAALVAAGPTVGIKGSD